MEKRAAELEAEVAKWLSAAEAADAEEDKQYGRDKTGDEMPEWVADKKRRPAPYGATARRCGFAYDSRAPRRPRDD